MRVLTCNIFIYHSLSSISICIQDQRTLMVIFIYCMLQNNHGYKRAQWSFMIILLCCVLQNNYGWNWVSIFSGYFSLLCTIEHPMLAKFINRTFLYRMGWKGSPEFIIIRHHHHCTIVLFILLLVKHCRTFCIYKLFFIK